MGSFERAGHSSIATRIGSMCTLTDCMCVCVKGGGENLQIKQRPYSCVCNFGKASKHVSHGSWETELAGDGQLHADSLDTVPC